MGRLQLGIYRHFKGNLYEVIGTARHSEHPDEEFVVYKALYSHPDYGRDSLWIRPLEMFLENVEREGKTMKRFTFIGPSSKKERFLSQEA